MKFLWNLHPEDEGPVPMSFGDSFEKAYREWGKICDDSTIERAYFLYSTHWASKGYWIEFTRPENFVGTVIRSKEVFRTRNSILTMYGVMPIKPNVTS